MSSATRIMECSELGYILLGDLRDLLEDPEAPETMHWLEVVLDALLDTIPEELALKSDEGYLNEVLEDFPNWQSKVEQLEDEYYALIRRLSRLRGQLRDQQHVSSLAPELSRDLQEWMDAFRTHRQEEQRLVLLAANLEVGGED